MWHPGAMAEQKNPLGPTGIAVAENVRRVREDRGFSFAELERRLIEVGRRIPVLGLAHIERGRRRVDSDDLAALALVLGVSPATLLMPVAEDDEDQVETTGMTTSAWATWMWLAAVRPPASSPEGPTPDVGEFRRRSRPRWESEEIAPLYTGEDVKRERDAGKTEFLKNLADAGFISYREGGLGKLTDGDG